ncbi:MAG: sugar phosphate isomerase/epimerase [Planctomycetaceae bacterium]|nr:sugar phosphate isomerase/epimerase [Planctomycetaceae bacterium]
MDEKISFTVFTKPWPKLPPAELAAFVKAMGFDGIEMPVRPGYPVTPENVGKALPEAARIMADCGVRIGTVAGPTDEQTIAACAAAGVPIIRICVNIPRETDYLSGIALHQKQWDALMPMLERYGVAIGLQNHCGRYVANAMQIYHAISQYDPHQICAVWDAGHNGLEGEQVDVALDIVWSHLRVVNLKSALWKPYPADENGQVQWGTTWTTARQGRANWPWVARELVQRGFVGDVCLTAEYSDHDHVNEQTAEDIQYARALFESAAKG